jgi:hypothetical protein
MMTYNTWKTETKRGPLTPRSKKLKAIDDAFESYETAKKSGGGTKQQVALFDALLNWINGKGAGWKGSTRNSTKDVSNKGTVERLLEDLTKLNPAFKVKAAHLLAAPTPPPRVVLEHGRKFNQRDADGSWHQINVQQKENSCGPCSIRMVIKLVNNEDVGEDYLRELVEMAEEGANYGGNMGDGGVVTTGGAHDWSPNGGGTWLVPAALKGVRPPINAVHTADQTDLLRTTKKRPAIGVVSWTNGGLHYVVVAGLVDGGKKLLILDPFNGVQHMDVTSGGGLSRYKPKDPNSGQQLAEALWYPWVCKVV